MIVNMLFYIEGLAVGVAFGAIERPLQQHLKVQGKEFVFNTIRAPVFGRYRKSTSIRHFEQYNQ